MAEEVLQLNDAVHVTREGHDTKLEGVVVFTGSVSFADGNDWVGVRLTGAAAGLGKNDGSVQGVQYFTCPLNCGMFVRESAVTKRSLTRLEELRLRRELATADKATASSAPATTAAATTTSAATPTAAATTATATAVATTPPRTARTPTKATAAATAIETTTPSKTPKAATPAATKTKTKLEELRLRRAALAEKKEGAATAAAATTTTTSSSTAAADTEASSSPAKQDLRLRRAALAEKKEGAAAAAATATPTADTEPSSVQPSLAAAATTTATTVAPPAPAPPQPNLQPFLDKLQLQVQELTEKLRVRERDASALQQKLSQAEQEVHEARALVVELQETTEAAVNEAAASFTAAAVTASAANEPPPPPTPTKDKNDRVLQERLQDALMEISNLKRQTEVTQETNAAMQQELADLRSNTAKDSETNTAIVKEQQDALSTARSNVTALQTELQVLSDQTANRGTQESSHYKERAKLQAEISAWKRKAEELETEKLEMDAALEEVALDKEQLQEEKEALEDRLEELKLDTETAQMEVEELRMELEDTKAAVERVTSFKDEATAGGGGGEAEIKAEELAQVLTAQNARLREALIRLREQSAIETMELSRQLRAAEKDAEAGRALSSEVEALRAMKATFAEQINDLKDMVEEGAAFEQMVEDLSDQVLTLEEDSIGLQAMIREMEESAELTSEMEEIQAEELKEMSRDLEGRDTIIRNLEEAIKMQRHREADFQRTLGNYRTTVDTLRQERQGLLDLQQGGEGEKSDLIASSQKALARAAQLVSDAAAMRKRDAQAVMNQIDHKTYIHLATRIESLLPQTVVAAEMSAVKGELMVAKAVGKASKSLEGIATSLSEAIRPGLAAMDEADAASATTALQLSDTAKQEAKTMIHQAEFAHVVVEASSDLLRFLSAGQWPDLLSQDSSIELGSLLGHSISELDNMLGLLLKSMKEEGVLTPERSSIGALQQTIQTTMQTLRTDIEREDGTLLPASWNPPGWQLMKDASSAKFACLGAAASLSSVLNQMDEASTPSSLVSLYNRLEQASAQSVNVCLRLASLDVSNDGLVDELARIAAEWKEKSAAVLSALEGILLNGGDMEACNKLAQGALKDLSRLSSALRSANLIPNEDESFHALSPETEDVWDQISRLSRSIRAIDGDEEDVNYLLRARAIEQHLGEAVENEPKLALANAKVASLEKNISSRSKEIAMQNARLSELEKLLAKSSASPVGRGKSSDLKSSEEFNSLKEENRVLTEAVDVMQRQVDEYENEIRLLKDFKSPTKRGQGGNRTPRRSMTTVADLSPHGRGNVEDAQVSSGALEAALFRPALHKALKEAAHWKAATTASSIFDLPPLPMLFGSRDVEERNSLQQLSSALSSYRLEKASVRIVDLTNREKSPRVQLREHAARKTAASARLETLVLRSRGRMHQ